MTASALWGLREGDRVTFGGGIVGVVEVADAAGVAVRWPDSTRSTLWIEHADRGFDMRHTLLTKVLPNGVSNA